MPTKYATEVINTVTLLKSEDTFVLDIIHVHFQTKQKKHKKGCYNLSNNRIIQ